MLAVHLIFGTYGFWLPNDPRGSWSTYVGSWELFRFGPATKTTETRSLASRPHNRERRLAAKRALKRPAVRFSEVQVDAVAAGFAEYAARSRVRVLACAIMPDHVHLALAAHRLGTASLAVQFKAAATRELTRRQCHPFAHFATGTRPPKCFARGEWKVYLDTDADVWRSIEYINQNPVKEGGVAQSWNWITPYEG